jgi:uncharacterized membrane protein YqiK
MFALNGLAIVAVALGLLVVLVLLWGIRYIPNDRVGVIEKRWSLKGSIKSGFVALGGEAGYQPNLLRGGIHYLLPLQYRVHKTGLVTIPQGKIGYVFARDGSALSPTQTLAASAPNSQFQDVRQFLTGGGQRGPQRQILREGTYSAAKRTRSSVRWPRPSRSAAASRPSSSRAPTT